MLKLLKGVFLYPYYRFMLARIVSESLKEFPRRMEIFKQQLVQDTSVPDDELVVKCLQEGERLRVVLREELEQKIADLQSQMTS